MEQMLNDAMLLDDAVPSNSKYLAKEDVGQGLLVHISHMTLDDVETDNVMNRLAVLHFHGDTKPLILKKTNKELLKLATGEVTIAGIRNKQVILYNDMTILFQGRLVGGIRIRSPHQQPTPLVTGTMPEAGTIPPLFDPSTANPGTIPGSPPIVTGPVHTELGKASGVGQTVEQQFDNAVPGQDYDGDHDDIPY